MSFRHLLIGAAAAALLGFAWFVWPTRYVELPPVHEPRAMPARMDRLTGEVQVQTAPDTWEPFGVREAARGSAGGPFDRPVLRQPEVDGGRHQVEQMERDLEAHQRAVREATTR